MDDGTKYYSVITDMWHLKLPDPLENGYESMEDFRRSIRRLSDFWKGRVGVIIAERNNFVRLQFVDTPGGRFDEAWIPKYLIKEVPIPDFIRDYVPEEIDPIEEEINHIYGFD